MTPRALIVDDDPGFLLGLSEVVKREGFEVFGAESLKQAREEIAAHQPDILLLDLELPDGSGLDLLEDFDGMSSPEVILTLGMRASRRRSKPCAAALMTTSRSLSTSRGSKWRWASCLAPSR